MGNTRSIPADVLARITAPKPHKKSATEEHIFADNQRAKTNAKLIAELAPARRSTLMQGEGK